MIDEKKTPRNRLDQESKAPTVNNSKGLTTDLFQGLQIDCSVVLTVVRHWLTGQEYSQQ